VTVVVVQVTQSCELRTLTKLPNGVPSGNGILNCTFTGLFDASLKYNGVLDWLFPISTTASTLGTPACVATVGFSRIGLLSIPVNQELLSVLTYISPGAFTSILSANHDDCNTNGILLSQSVLNPK
jgi:hypothetical protein